MHMANELLSPSVAIGTGLIALGGIGWAARRIRDQAHSHLVPLMGVLGAFVFSAQMVNFSLPTLAGTSDHLIGTVLLAILLGPHAAVITMAGILIIQCLFFQDGGLIALGANIINMGILPAYAGWGLWRWIRGSGNPVSPGRLLPAAWTACFVAVTLGAVGVCVEVGLSLRLGIPLSKFSAAMIGVHLISAAIEGFITCAILVFLYKLYPAMSNVTINWEAGKVSLRGTGMMFGISALVIAGSISWLASPYADGLEWAVSKPDTLKPQTAFTVRVDQFQEKYTPLPDYSSRSAPAESAEDTWPNINFWTSFSGLLGVGLSLILIWTVGKFLIPKSKIENRKSKIPSGAG
jgi:cobalt/nickel transport system permease protein